MKTLHNQVETTQAIQIHGKIKASELDLTEDYESIIDCYFNGANGWTYSHSLLDDNHVNLDTSEDYEDLFLTRNYKETPEPLLYLSGSEFTECEIIIYKEVK